MYHPAAGANKPGVAVKNMVNIHVILLKQASLYCMILFTG